MPTTTRRLSTLFLDPTLYPRHTVNTVNVANMIEAIHAGHELPPISIDAKTATVIDGFHRVHAYQRVHGDDFAVPVKAKTYPDRAAMLIDAIAANVHGPLPLSRWDYDRCLTLAEEQHIGFDTMANLLHWRQDRLAAYREKRSAMTIGRKRLGLKQSIRHMAGQTLNETQEQANEKLSGWSPRFHADQLILLLESDLMPADDSVLRERFLHLAELAHAWAIDVDLDGEETA